MATSTLQGLWSQHKNSRHITKVGSTLYVVTSSGDNLYMNRSDDNGQTWTTVTTIITSRASITGFNVAGVVGTTIYVTVSSWANVSLIDQVIIYTYNTLTHTWSALNGVLSTAGSSTTTIIPHSSVVRSNGNVVVLHQSATQSSMGTAYRRVSVSRWSGSSWTTTAIPATTATTHCDVSNIILGSSDRVQLFFTITTSAPTKYVAMRTLTSANALSTADRTVASTANTSSTAAYPTGQGLLVGPTVYLMRLTNGGTAQVASGTDSDDIASWVSSAIGDFGNTAEQNNSSPGAVVHDGTKWKAFWINDAQDTIYKDESTDGTTWGTDTIHTSSVGPINGINAISDASGDYVLYDNDGVITLEYPTATVTEGAPVVTSDSVTIVATEQFDSVVTESFVEYTDTGLLGSIESVENIITSTFIDVAYTDTGTLFMADEYVSSNDQVVSDTGLLQSSEQYVDITDRVLSLSETSTLGSTESAAGVGDVILGESATVASAESYDQTSTVDVSYADTALLSSVELLSGAITHELGDAVSITSADVLDTYGESTYADSGIVTTSETLLSDNFSELSDAHTFVVDEAYAETSTSTHEYVDNSLITSAESLTQQGDFALSDAHILGSVEVYEDFTNEDYGAPDYLIGSTESFDIVAEYFSFDTVALISAESYSEDVSVATGYDDSFTLGSDESIAVESFVVATDTGELSEITEVSFDIFWSTDDSAPLTDFVDLVLTSDLSVAEMGELVAVDTLDSLTVESMSSDDVALITEESWIHVADAIYAESALVASESDVAIYATPDTLTDASALVGASEALTGASTVSVDDLTLLLSSEDVATVVDLSLTDAVTIAGAESADISGDGQTVFGDAAVISATDTMNIMTEASVSEIITVFSVEVYEFKNDVEFTDEHVFTVSENSGIVATSLYGETALLGSDEVADVEMSQNQTYSDTNTLSAQETMQILSTMERDDSVLLTGSDAFTLGADLSLLDAVDLVSDEQYLSTSLLEEFYMDAVLLGSTDYINITTDNVVEPGPVDIGTPISLHLVSSNPFIRSTYRQEPLMRYHENMEPMLRGLPRLKMKKVATKPTLFKQGKLNVR